MVLSDRLIPILNYHNYYGGVIVPQAVGNELRMVDLSLVSHN
jgi:hypothetical protein